MIAHWLERSFERRFARTGYDVEILEPNLRSRWQIVWQPGPPDNLFYARTIIGDDRLHGLHVRGRNGAHESPAIRRQNPHLLRFLYFPASLDHGIDSLRIGRKFLISFVRFHHGIDRKRPLTHQLSVTSTPGNECPNLGSPISLSPKAGVWKCNTAALNG